MWQPGLPNSTTNFNTFPFLLCGSPDQQTLRFPQRALWKQINVCICASARAYIHTYTQTSQGTLAQPCASGPLKQSCETTHSLLQIRLHLRAEPRSARTHPHLKLEAHVHAAHTHTFHTHIILSNQIFLHKPSWFCEHTKSAKTSKVRKH